MNEWIYSQRYLFLVFGITFLLVSYSMAYSHYTPQIWIFVFFFAGSGCIWGYDYAVRKAQIFWEKKK